MVVQFQAYHGPARSRIDHFQILTPEVPKACQFYCDIGFRLSEFIAPDNTDDLLFVFLQRKGNPHDIVFANGSGPRLHHAAFSVPDAQHILQACDIAGAHGFGGNLEQSAPAGTVRGMPCSLTSATPMATASSCSTRTTR